MAGNSASASSRPSFSLQRFMVIMKTASTKDLVIKINKFTQDMDNVKKPEPNKDSYLVQTFLQRMETELVRHRVYSTMSESDKLVLSEGIETYVLTKLYKRTFACYEADIERDNLLSSRLYALQFVSPSHLDISANVITNEKLVSAINELQKINSYKAPKDKLSCILNCCQSIQHLLHSSGQHTGADAFMPVLNYIVIKAQPMHLISNIEYIRRFRMKSKLVSYDDYYFTQLSGSVFFIEKADAGSFTGGRQEFLSSFLQQGLITWKQYEQALQEENHAENQTELTYTTKENSETSFIDDEYGGTSSIGDLKSLKDDHLHSTRSIDWTNVKDVNQLFKDGYPLVTQLTASGDLIARNPLMSSHCGDLTVAQLERLLQDYKKLALNHEVILEATRNHDTASVLGFISEFEIKIHWRSAWPSEGRLLMKYPFLCSSFQSLTFRDIARLLNSYKILVLKSEALVAGIKRRIIPEAVNGQSQSTLDFSSYDDYQEPYFKDPQETEAPLITRLSGPIENQDNNTFVNFRSSSGSFRQNTSSHQKQQTQISHESNSEQANETLESLSDFRTMPSTSTTPIPESSNDFSIECAHEIEVKEREDDISINLEVLNEGTENVTVHLNLLIDDKY